VFTRKKATSNESIDPRRGVSARNVNALARSTVVLPPNSDPVRCILAANTKRARYATGTDVLKANQAHSSDCVTILKFRTKWSRQLALDNRWIDAVIDEKAATY